MKILYLNCGERYQDMINHRSYTHNLSSCEIKAWKKIIIQAWTRFEPMTSAIPVQCSTNCELVTLFVCNIHVDWTADIPGVTNRWNRWSIKIDISRWQSISINRLILIIDDQSMKIFVTLSIGIDWHRLSLIAIDCHRLPSIVIDYHNAVFYYLFGLSISPSGH